MLKTMDLDYIINNLQEELFDFDYDFADITIGNKTYNKQLLQDTFTEYWYYYHIGYSTLEEFKWRLKRTWKATIGVFAQKLSLYPQELNLKDRTYTKEYSSDTDNKYSDTPNQPMLDVDTDGKYLTDRTYVNINGNNTETETKNELDKYFELEKKVQDTMYEYIKSFKNLFITDVIIENGILKGGL